MLARAYGSTLFGVDGVRVTIEVDAGRGLPSFQIVGQPDRVVSESRDRIRAAFRQGGLEFPPGRVTVNLVPAELPKAGTALDLPIAVAIAATRVELSPELLASTLFVGELGLDGALHPVRGALALVASSYASGLARAIVPAASHAEAAVCPGIEARGAEDLVSVVRFLRGESDLPREPPGPLAAEAVGGPAEPDLSEVRGQEGARRALEIAAAGGHNLRLVGPPGCGKTLLARRLPGLLPDLPFAEALEATRIHGVAGTLGGRTLLVRPPFRAPHHTSSEAGLIGGGRPLRPGEISLAHRGVLFLDELPEFRRPALEALRQPLEEGAIRLVRSHGAFTLGARFQLLAAMNPCPCGYRGDPSRDCSCDEAALRRYRARLSGPLMDRIDLHVPVPRLEWRDLHSGSTAESSVAVRERVEAARARQDRRHAGRPYRTNAELPARTAMRGLDEPARALLEWAVDALGLSMRAYVRTLRVARTIADLDRAHSPEAPPAAAHVAEALGFRR